MPSDLLWLLIDPMALPANWPAGGLGTFLLFLLPGGIGVPLGVIVGSDASLSPALMALMYFVSDIVMAVTHEPLIWLLAWLARLLPSVARTRDMLARASAAAGLKDEGVHGPVGLVLFSYAIDPVLARGAAASAGHGFLAGWTFSVLGDMFYFGTLMASTLWLRDIIGDDRATVGVALLSVWGLSWYIRKRLKQASRSQAHAGQPAPSAKTVDGTVLQPTLVRATAAHAPEQPATSIQLQPARSAPPTSAAIRKRSGRKRRPH